MRRLATAMIAALAAMAHAQTCPVVDRGSPVDGVTTISVLQTPAACADPIFVGWRCAIWQSAANDNGAVYDFDVRWNRDGQPSTGTVIWVGGGNGTGSIRDISFTGRGMQDQLAAQDQVRSIDVRLMGSGTKTFPRNGFVNISAIYADLIEQLVATGLAEGPVAYFGHSNGTMNGAYALAYQRLDQLVDGVIFGGGPFWPDLETTCTDPSSPIFLETQFRAQVDDWNWKELNGGNFCLNQAPASLPSYECRSIFGPDADAAHPALRVHVLVGTGDSFNPFMTAAAGAYADGVTAAEVTFDTPEAPHLVLTSPEGSALVSQYIDGIMAGGVDPVFGDLDGDGLVGISDFLAMLAAWGPCGDCGDCPSDLDGDCITGINDLLALLANWS